MMRPVWRPVVALLLACGVLCGLVPVASAEPVIDATSADLPDEFDMSWLDTPYEYGGVTIENANEAYADADMGQLQGALNVSWRNCVSVINQAKADGDDEIWVSGAMYGNSGVCRTPPTLLARIFDWRGKYADVRRIKLSELDLGLIAHELALGAMHQQSSDPVEKVKADADAGASTMEVAGGGLGAQLTGAVAQAAGVPGGVVQAVADPTGSADKMLNRWKEDVSKGMGQALGWLSDGLAFDASLVSFRNAYAAAAGVGLVLLAGGSLVALVGWRRSELPASEVVSRWGAALLGGVLGLAFTPAMLYVVTEASDVLSDGVVSWMQTDQAAITGSLLDPFAAMDTSHTLLGWLGVLLLILLMLVGAVMVIATFAIQWLVAYLGGVGLGLLWGLMPLKGGRRRLAQAGAMVVGAIVARPLMLFMLGVAMRITNEFAPSADGWSMDPSATFFGLVLSVGALMMACLAPAALVRHVPAMGSGHLGAGFAGGLTGGLAGAGMGASMLAGRMASLAPRRPLRGLSGGVRRAGGRSAGGIGGGARPGGLRAAGAAGGGAGAGRSASGGGQGAAGSGRHVAGAEGGVSAPPRQGARDAAVQRGGEPLPGAGDVSPLPAQGASASGGERSVEAARPVGESGGAGSAGPGRVLTGADLSAQAGASGSGAGAVGGAGAGGSRVVGGLGRAAGGVARAAGAGGRVVAGAAGPVAAGVVAAGTHVAAAGVRAGGAGLAAGARAVQSARVEDVD